MESHQYPTLVLGLVVLFYGSKFAKKINDVLGKNPGQTWPRSVIR